MAEYRYVIVIDTDTEEHANQILGERINFDEEVWDENGNYITYKIDSDYRVQPELWGVYEGAAEVAVYPTEEAARKFVGVDADAMQVKRITD